jgi:dienelactone hydrolase
VVLFVPNKRSRPAPAFLLINNRSRRNTAASRDTISGFWPAEQVIESGYAIAAFHYSDAAPDNKNTYQEGVLRLYPELAKADNGMKAIGAWAWAASRVMDYFETDKDIDSKKVGVVGHSRGGKASLWAAAEDNRFAICFSNCSGNTGAALSKRNFGETVARINTVFPHWFNTNYKKFNNNEQALPVDQHMLIALVAPRPVYATNASEDLWADPTGTYLALKHAEPVFALYHQKSRLPANPPALDTPIVHPPLGYHNRTGKHDLTFYDWQQYVRFADAYYAK